MVTDTCHILTHPVLLLLVARVSPSQIRTPPANLFCTCLPALCPKALSTFLSCITSIPSTPFLRFPYPLLNSLPDISYNICLHPPIPPTLILLSLRGPCRILLLPPPAASSSPAASLSLWSLLILNPLPPSTRTTQTYPSVTHLILYLHICSPLHTCLMRSSGLSIVQCVYLHCTHNPKNEKIASNMQTVVLRH